jgi:hypothetical protein
LAEPEITKARKAVGIAAARTTPAARARASAEAEVIKGRKAARAVGMRCTTLAARARASSEAEMATASSSAIAELSGTFALSILPHAYACGRYSMLT